MRNTAAVLGSPIAHSLSPTIHNYLYGKYHLEWEYIAVEVKESEFKDWIRSALSESQQWLGFSLTMPLKESVCDPQLSDLLILDSEAKKIASANTIYRKDEKWHALSTDRLAFEYLLARHAFNSILIIGAGATARTAICALERVTVGRELEVQVLRRDNNRDAKLLQAAGNLQLEFMDWNAFRDWRSFDLVINTVPNSGVVELAGKFPGSAVLMDAIYAPWPPAFTAAQIRFGKPVISGLELLTAQALYQFQLMTGKSLDFDASFSEVLALLNQR
jgi:shikimate dehydrogenase